MSDYLKHYGILGMKWGVRRFQNPDGSLTPEGKLRYRKKEINKAIKEERRKFKQDVKAFKKNKLKYDTKYDKNLGTHVITQWYDSRGAKVGQDYVNKVMKQAMKEKTYASLAGTAAVLAGAGLVGTLIAELER